MVDLVTFWCPFASDYASHLGHVGFMAGATIDLTAGIIRNLTKVRIPLNENYVSFKKQKEKLLKL